MTIATAPTQHRSLKTYRRFAADSMKLFISLWSLRPSAYTCARLFHRAIVTVLLTLLVRNRTSTRAEPEPSVSSVVPNTLTSRVSDGYNTVFVCVWPTPASDFTIKWELDQSIDNSLTAIYEQPSNPMFSVLLVMFHGNLGETMATCKIARREQGANITTALANSDVVKIQQDAPGVTRVLLDEKNKDSQTFQLVVGVFALAIFALMFIIVFIWVSMHLKNPKAKENFAVYEKTNP